MLFVLHVTHVSKKQVVAIASKHGTVQSAVLENSWTVKVLLYSEQKVDFVALKKDFELAPRMFPLLKPWIHIEEKIPFARMPYTYQ